MARAIQVATNQYAQLDIHASPRQVHTDDISAAGLGQDAKK